MILAVGHLPGGLVVEFGLVVSFLRDPPVLFEIARKNGGVFMRRKEKQIHKREDIVAVIAEAQVCRLALCDGDTPYIVPMCFGYADHVFYFHCAAEGRKLDILRRNNNVCIELEAGVSLKAGAKACNWGMNFKSVIAFGRAEQVDAPDAKRQALDLIMARYAKGRFDYPEKVLAKTVILKVHVTTMTGKRSG
jgi:nitroimidazol reductase NimA-like FMN-containing flavoprotein (pyridoxamine 5'-phosphate oxidase superfamily)